MKSAATRAMPRCLVFRIVPCCLPHPKMHSNHRPARLRHAVTGMPCCAPVDGALAALGTAAVVLRDMRRDVHGPKLGHVLGRVVGDAVAGGFGFSLEHLLRSLSLGGSRGMRDKAGHRQPVPVSPW